jgi:hypothetical protein
MAFYIAIITFISSVIAGLMLMLLGRQMRREKVIVFAAMHAILLFGFLASLILKKSDSENMNNYFFLAFISSGIILSGIVWRSEVASGLKYYFIVFVLSIPLFIFSPSRLANFLLTTRYSDTTGPSFPVTGNYFIEFQNTSSVNNNAIRYKLIRKTGMFHKTIVRDIEFNGKLDSIKVLEFEKGKTAIVRGYTSIKTYVTSETDSTDVELNLFPLKQGEVEYRL